MIEYRCGDVFKLDEVNCILFAANCQGTLKDCRSKGFAAKVEKQFPQICQADAEMHRNNTSSKMLGKYVTAVNDDGNIAVALYTQLFYGKGKRFTSYDALDEILTSIVPKIDKVNNEGLKKITCGTYQGFGCINGGGKWPIVKSIFEQHFLDSATKLYIFHQ